MLITSFLLIPLLAAGGLAFCKSKFSQTLIVLAASLLLTCFAVYFNTTEIETFTLHFPHLIEVMEILADLVLLGFFFFIGLTYAKPKVYLLATLQIILYCLVEFGMDHGEGATLIIDGLSKVMFLIINIVGSIIVIYALKYMSYEQMGEFKKKLFIIYLLIFLFVMNMIVMSNSVLLFFFLFEMTTLASYLLIRFREDTTAVDNAFRALWMNQIGGIAILLGAMATSIEGSTIYFDQIINSNSHYILIGVSLLSLAAFVKGASMPFNGWLLGAMVAPTPVSAILHSATMVKVAPFLILKLSPVIAHTLVGSLITLLGGLVFVGATYLALSRDMLKEILGYSTIALLGLMMSIGAIGTKESFEIVAVLIVFHAISKAMLFLVAGIIEKKYHVKSIEDMKGLIEKSPKSVVFIMIGFTTMVLPPFGVFIGKLFAIQTVASLMEVHTWYLLELVLIIVGSALLSLLYFKVAAALFGKLSDLTPQKHEEFGVGFSFPIYLLTAILVYAMYVLLEYSNLPNSLYYLLIPVAIVLVIPLIMRSMKQFDRTKPYQCAERDSFDAAIFYFEPSRATTFYIYTFFTAMFVLVGISGVLA